MRAYTLGLYEKAMPSDLTWKEKLETAKEAGYDFVEISIDETDAKLARLEWTKEERLDLVKTMYEVGIPIQICVSADTGNIPSEAAVRKYAQEEWRSWRRPFSLQTIWESVSFSLPAMTYIMKNPHRKQ